MCVMVAMWRDGCGGVRAIHELPLQWDKRS